MTSYISYYHMNLHDIIHFSPCLDFPICEFSNFDDFLKFGLNIEESDHDQL